MDDVSHMTGENNFKRANRYSEVTFNGSKGEFYFRDKDAERDVNTNKYPKTNLGTELAVIFLKVRRVLQAKYNPREPSLRTSEHNVKGDAVWLYKGKDKAGTAVADKTLAMESKLYTNQIVYCYLPEKKEVVRLILKGASLGSDKTAKGVLKFYDYMQSFKGGEHMRDYVTNLVPVTEKGPQGDYYAVDFQRGLELTLERKETVVGLIKEVHDAIIKNDERTKATPTDTVAPFPDDSDDEDDVGGYRAVGTDIKYPDEDINPEDIPF